MTHNTTHKEGLEEDKRLEGDKRLEEALKIMRGFRDLGVHNELCHNLPQFSSILNNWIKTGEYSEGYIRLPEVNRKIVYKLNRPNKDTVVKLKVIT